MRGRRHQTPTKNTFFSPPIYRGGRPAALARRYLDTVPSLLFTRIMGRPGASVADSSPRDSRRRRRRPSEVRPSRLWACPEQKEGRKRKAPRKRATAFFFSFLPSIPTFRERLGFHSFLLFAPGTMEKFARDHGAVLYTELDVDYLRLQVLQTCSCASRQLANFCIHPPSPSCLSHSLSSRKSRRIRADGRRGDPSLRPPASECGHRLSSPLFYSSGKFLL